MKVGIVMPTYRHAGHIGAAVESIRSQAHPNWILRVVLDGADHRTEEVLEGLGCPFKVCSHRGTAETLNAGFESLPPDVDALTWVSSDNVMYRDWLRDLVSYLEAHSSIDAVYSSYNRQQGSLLDRWVTRGSRPVREPYRPLIQSENCFIGPSFLYRQTLAERVGKHRGGISHDYDWWLRAEELGTIAHLDRVLCDYRVHDERASVKQRHAYDAPRWQEAARERRRLQQ